jgi:ABC-type branched-subunit amino acid transport system substrate-binding protein
MKNSAFKIFLLFTLLFLTSCGGIKMLSSGSNDYYSKPFLNQISEIKTQYKRGNSESALSSLQGMNEEALNAQEKALRRNLIGVIYFGKSNYEQAIFNFNQALEFSTEDQNLTAQIHLNLGSSYFKLGMKEKAYGIIKKAPYKALSPSEMVKFHKLRYRLASENNEEKDALVSLIYTLSQKEKISQLRIDPLYEVLVTKFRNLEQTEKYKILEEFEESAPFIVGYLSYLEAEKVYYKGQKDEAKDLIKWVETNFSKHSEIASLLKNFTYRVENYARLDSKTIGVILPLTGKRAKFAKRALLGIDAALREFKKSNADIPNYKIIVKDSLGSGVVGAHQVKELVEKHFVSVIIGGLDPLEATKEYEIAKKRGVFFVSLSEIYMGKEKKDHLLVEIPGSIESQVNQIFSSNVVKKFGEKGAIIFPESKMGRAYANEFWRRANLMQMPIAGVFSFDRTKKDYRDPVKNLLGLKFPRTRLEEFEILNEIHSLERSKSIRRIQTLKPQRDFDWVFVPALPLDAIQIIPSFTYYDAFNVPFIGAPNWRSNLLSQESYKFKNIHFIGDSVEKVADELSESFQRNYGKKIGLVELRSLDSMQIVINVLKDASFQSRDELDMAIRSMNEVSGQTGTWNLVDGVWIKNMASLHFRNGKIGKLELETKTATDIQSI